MLLEIAIVGGVFFSYKKEFEVSVGDWKLFPRAPDGRVTKARGEGRGNTGWMKCMLF